MCFRPPVGWVAQPGGFYGLSPSIHAWHYLLLEKIITVMRVCLLTTYIGTVKLQA